MKRTWRGCPKVGDVIKLKFNPSSRCTWQFEGKEVSVLRKDEGKDANDLSRQNAEFVVEKAGDEQVGDCSEQGGGEGSSGMVWSVFARKLKSGRYDSKGKLIALEILREGSEDNCNEHCIFPKDITILPRKMRRIVTFVDC